MISIIVPIYKVEPYLDKCIRSILNQTYRNLQIILVDDGSPDGCGAICDFYKVYDERVCVIHKTNGGLSDARNAGLEVASGEYIGFVDSDDFIHPQMYEVLLGNLTGTNSDISVCGFQWIGEEQFPEGPGENIYHIFEGKDILEQLIEDNVTTVLAWNKLYKREVFENKRYEVGRLHEDEFIIHKILADIERIVYTDMKLYYYVKRSGSIVNAKNIKSIIDAWDALEDRCIFLKNLDMRLYSFSRRLQLEILLYSYYALISKEEEAICNTLNHLKKQAQDIVREKEIWKFLPRRFKIQIKFFLITPDLYKNIKNIMCKGKKEV